MPPTDYSIVIRAKDEARRIGQVLEAVSAQTLAQRSEVIVVDSGSTDGTVEIARRWGARVCCIPSRAFTYGYSINQGMGLAQGSIAVILSAHAVPTSRDWLRCLTSPFEDPRIGGVFGRQVPHADCDPLVALSLRRWFPPDSQACKLVFSNANSSVRRSLWERVPFDETLPGGEDASWARTVTSLGFQTVYAPDAAVYYAREDSLYQAFRRAARETYAETLTVGPTSRGLARSISGPLWNGGKDAFALIVGTDLPLWPWVLLAIPRRVAIELGVIRGRRAALTRRNLSAMSRR